MGRTETDQVTSNSQTVGTAGTGNALQHEVFIMSAEHPADSHGNEADPDAVYVESTETVIGAIVQTVAEATARDPLELKPLFAVIDPDAVEGIFDRPSLTTSRSNATLRFTYEGCDVSIEGTENGTTVRATTVDDARPS